MGGRKMKARRSKMRHQQSDLHVAAGGKGFQ